MADAGQLHGFELRSIFSAWIDPLSTITPPVVIVGAGLSYKLVPTADDYGEEIGLKSRDIELALGISTTTVPTNSGSLYEWAGQCIEELMAAGLEERDAKLILARAMGLTTDARFLGKSNVPSRGTTPRHRVLSRLAREGRVESFWSFNWDCWLETSLESVGFRRGQRVGQGLVAPSEWRLRYLVWFSGAASSIQTDTVPIFKAHGCAQALYDSQGEFVITRAEMAKPLSEQPLERTTRMRNEVSDRCVISIGWSATEGYVKQLFRELGESGLLCEKLAIVDLNTSQAGHVEVCESFRVDPLAAGVTVNGSSPGTTDDLLLWVQTLRGCSAIRTACERFPVLQTEVDSVVAGTFVFDDPRFQSSSLVSMIDNWLPAWLRICFFVRAQPHRFTAGNEFEVLPTEQRDAHIPWAPLSNDRDDLMAVVNVMKAVEGKQVEWDFETFPGAFWNPSSQELVFPVPIWATPDDISSTFLKPVMNDWRDSSRISNVRLLPLDTPARSIANVPERMERIERWKESLAPCFGHQHLSLASNLENIEISQFRVACGESP